MSEDDENETSSRTFMSSGEFEEDIKENRFRENGSIDDILLINLRHYGTLKVKLPAEFNEKNPYDGYTWSKTKFGKDKKVINRHQPTYKRLKIFGEDVVSLNCTEYSNPSLHKQVITYKDHTFVYYFSTSDEKVPMPENPPTRRISRMTSNILKSSVLPFRTLSSALKVSQEMGLHLSRKQIQNAARSSSTSVIGKTGPRARTTLKMAEEIKKENPGRVWFTTDDENYLRDFTCVKVFTDSIRIFYNSCPEEGVWENWIRFCDDVTNSDSKTRQISIKNCLSRCPSGIFMPSRMHVDTTFNLGDLYVTVVLGEVGSFITKTSSKPRVIPLGFMLHSSKKADAHDKFAHALRDEIENVKDPLRPRKIPCILLDGEYSLETYATNLETKAIRCDLHILSLMRHNYGGKAAMEVAKPYLFGKKIGGKWLTGLFGCFTEDVFDRRLSKIHGKVDDRIYDWLKLNRRMLMDSVSARAKLVGGHLLQYSTNNQNENFNGSLKVNISKRLSAPELLYKITEVCQDKIRDCWLSTIDASEHVKLKKDLDGLDFYERRGVFNELGLLGPSFLALNPPVEIAKNVNIDQIGKEEIKLQSIVIINKTSDAFQLEDISAPFNDRLNRFTVVGISYGFLECWSCERGMPNHMCSHVIYCVSKLNKREQYLYWRMALRKLESKKNSLSKSSGSKLSDRFGTRQSARNFTRRMDDISELSFFQDDGDSENRMSSTYADLTINSNRSSMIFSPTPLNASTSSLDTTRETLHFNLTKKISPTPLDSTTSSLDTTREKLHSNLTKKISPTPLDSTTSSLDTTREKLHSNLTKKISPTPLDSTTSSLDTTREKLHSNLTKKISSTPLDSSSSSLDTTREKLHSNLTKKISSTPLDSSSSSLDTTREKLHSNLTKKISSTPLDSTSSSLDTTREKLHSNLTKKISPTPLDSTTSSLDTTREKLHSNLTKKISSTPLDSSSSSLDTTREKLHSNLTKKISSTPLDSTSSSLDTTREKLHSNLTKKISSTPLDSTSSSLDTTREKLHSNLTKKISSTPLDSSSSSLDTTRELRRSNRIKNLSPIPLNATTSLNTTGESRRSNRMKVRRSVFSPTNGGGRRSTDSGNSPSL